MSILDGFAVSFGSFLSSIRLPSTSRQWNRNSSTLRVVPQLVDSPIDLSFGGTFHDTDSSLHCDSLRGRSPTHTNSGHLSALQIPPSLGLVGVGEIPLGPRYDQVDSVRRFQCIITRQYLPLYKGSGSLHRIIPCPSWFQNVTWPIPLLNFHICPQIPSLHSLQWRGGFERD